MVSPVYIRPVLALLVMAAVIGIATVVFRYGPSDSDSVKPVSQQLPHNIDVSLKKARFSEIQDGLVVWELVAERADYDKEVDTAYLTEIRMEFQNAGTFGVVIVTADSGEYSSALKTVRLKGHVHVATKDGASFKTGSILYSGATGLFSTTDMVTFRQQRLQLTAVGMDLGVKNQRALFYSSVNASINMN